MRPLQLLYAVFCTVWAAWFSHGQISFYLSHPDDPITGPVYCIALFVVLPAILGYFLLFRAFPWLNRLVRR